MIVPRWHHGIIFGCAGRGRRSSTLARTCGLLATGAALLTLVAASAQEPATSGEQPVALESAGATAAILPVHGEITDVMKTSLERRMAKAQELGATVIVFDMNTPGGLVTSSLAIADLIKNVSGVKTVAWVNTNAHSGGTIVAVACDEIVMARSSRMGDSQVIMGGPTGVGAVPEELRPKAYTPVLAEFRASARLRGYDQTLCEAFVLPQREVWWLEHLETGEREFVFREEKLKRLGETDEKADVDDEDADSADPNDESFEPKWKLVEKYHDPVLEMDVETIQPIVRSDQLLEMSPGEAYAYGFSKGIAANEGELRERYQLASITRIEPNWSEAFAYWLTSMYVRGFLIVIILLGAYVEFHTPGVGVPGLVALICLAIFVGAPYLTGLANVWEIVLIFFGLLLILLEVFVIPGFGIAGIAGIVLFLLGLVATFVPDEPGRSFPLYIPSLPSTMQWLKMAIATVVSSMVASLIGMVALSKFLPRLPMFQALAPANPTPSEVAVEDPYRGAARIGDIGKSEGPLHPAGKARFGSVLVDVVTQGEYLEADVRVEVIERRGNRVVVRAVS
jgi:membrane-bound serine protease (ClpP class)